MKKLIIISAIFTAITLSSCTKEYYIYEEDAQSEVVRRYSFVSPAEGRAPGNTFTYIYTVPSKNVYVVDEWIYHNQNPSQDILVVELSNGYFFLISEGYPTSYISAPSLPDYFGYPTVKPYIYGQILVWYFSTQVGCVIRGTDGDVVNIGCDWNKNQSPLF